MANFSGLTPALQIAYELNYEFQVKSILLFGWFIFSLFYVFYLYKNQKPTPYFLVGSFRAVMYAVSYIWMWLFFLLYPVMIQPRVGIDTLLIFVASVYSILFTVFMVILVTNFTLFIPQFIFQRGKFDFVNTESYAIKKYFSKVKRYR